METMIRNANHEKLTVFRVGIFAKATFASISLVLLISSRSIKILSRVLQADGAIGPQIVQARR